MQLNYIESEDLEKIRKSVDLSKGGEDLVCFFFDLVNKTFSIEISRMLVCVRAKVRSHMCVR